MTPQATAEKNTGEPIIGGDWRPGHDPANERKIIKNTIEKNEFMRWTPQPKQIEFMLHPAEEVFYGGEAGGGKTAAQLMSALQFVGNPKYSALLIRRSFPQLKMEGSLIPKSREVLGPTEAKYNKQDHKWTFPSGATIEFGFLRNEGEEQQYDSAEFDFIGFDEATQIRPKQIQYLNSRLRSPIGNQIPPRLRLTGNPGGPAHDFLRERFVEGPHPFIPARLEDNSFLDTESYDRSLRKLDPVTYQRYRKGDWEVTEEGNLFNPNDFIRLGEVPDNAITRRVRYWDLAGTESSSASWTVGVLVARTNSGDLPKTVVIDVDRFKAEPGGVENRIKQVSATDPDSVEQWIEREPGSSGKTTIHHYDNNVLPASQVCGHNPTGDKTERARPVSAAVSNESVGIVGASWNNEFLREARQFPGGDTADQIDAFAGSYSALWDLIEPDKKKPTKPRRLQL